MIFTPIDKSNNMNVVRYYLCMCILMNHFNVLNEASLPILPRIFGGVGSFFAISGFLMFASFEKRPRLKGYLNRRARRIFPPYIFIVLLAALGLSLVSTLSPAEYFTDPTLYKYLIANLTFMNFLAPTLPGVFSSGLNYVETVNGALWTMKGEVVCYLSVPLVFAIIRRYPQYVSQILCSLIIVCFCLYVSMALYVGGIEHGMIGILAKQFRVFTFFYTGALINVHLDKLRRYKWPILAVVIALIIVSSFHSLLAMTLRPFTDSVLVIWCSIIGSWGHFLSRYNSLSYDIYLFHYPIIQCLISLGIVSLTGLWTSLAIAILMSVTLASFSWLCIGKPILNGGPRPSRPITIQ